MKPKIHFSLKKLSGSFLLSIGLNTTAHAQQDLDELIELSPAELAEISVSIASGTAKTAAQSAAVTSVITAEQISAMGATDLHEVLETVPGMHVTIQPVTGDYNYTMRGIRNETNAEVLLMMNGTRFSTPYQGTHMTRMIIPVENIQRVEIIRGPGSAMYGADAFAGVINIVTKKAGDIDGVNVGARGGNDDTKSTWGQYGGQWQGWNVASSLQYSHNGFDGDRIIKTDILGSSPPSLAPGPMQTQNERWNGHLNLQRKHWDIGFWAFNEADAGLNAGTAGALDTKGRTNGSNYLADFRYSTEDDIENLELQGHASFLHTDVDANIYAYPAGSVLRVGDNGANVSFPNGARFVPGFKNTVPTFEFTGIYKGIHNNILRMVTSYRYEELNVKEFRNFGPGVTTDNPLQIGPDGTFIAPPLTNMTGNAQYAFLTDHHRDIASIALQDEWAFAKNWNFTLGLRYDHYSDFGSTWNPRAALVWDINSKLTAKLLYGQAYRAPSFIEQYQNNKALFVGNPNIQPETISTTELAFDYRPTNNVRTGLNLYHYEIKDLLGIPKYQPGKDYLTEENLAGQDGYGSEFEWDWKFLPSWNLRGNYAWQFARSEASHLRVNNMPEHHVYSALAWNFMPKWQIQTQVNWIGHRIGDQNQDVAAPPVTLNDYETVDLTLNAKRLMGHLDLTASVRNLFDAHGIEPTKAGLTSYGLPIATQTFYFEASIHY
jgi:iron complex outermembrane receptor protein